MPNIMTTLNIVTIDQHIEPHPRTIFPCRVNMHSGNCIYTHGHILKLLFHDINMGKLTDEIH